MKDVEELIIFMNGPDKPTLAAMISFFSHESRYLHPRELKRFWDSLSDEEKLWWRFVIREVSPR